MDKNELVKELYGLKLRKLQLLQQQYWQKHPMKWLQERFGEPEADYRWSLLPEYIGHDWDGDIDPLANVWTDVANRDWAAIEAATGTSKTYFLSRLVFWFLDVYPDSLVVTSAPKEAQLKLHLWSEISKAFYKFKKVRPHAELLKLRLKVDGRQPDDGENPDLSESWQAVGFIAGTGADELSATKAQGFHRKDMLIITEETAGMPASVLTAFKNTCTGGNNIICAVGNPDNEFDPLHQFALLSNVKNYRISAYDYPNVVAGSELIHGAVTRESIDRRKDDYGEDSPMYQSRVRGISPAQSRNSLILLDWIEQCVETDYKSDKGDGYNAVGVDVANSENGDKAAIAWGNSNTLLGIMEFQCPNATHLGYNLLYGSGELAAKGYTDFQTPTLAELGVQDDCVGVDSVGVGVATVNALTDMGCMVQSLHGGYWEEAIPKDRHGNLLYKFASLRAQMYWELREDFRKRQVNIKVKKDLLNQLKKELTVPRFEASNAYITVEGKEQIKKRLGGKSPNVADAVVYWNWVRKRYRAKEGFALPVFGGL